MNKQQKDVCERLVKEILPQTGTWSHPVYENDEQFMEFNVPFRATDKDWMTKYVLYVAKEKTQKYNIDMALVEEFVQSKNFDNLLKDYQEKIVDFQLAFAKKHDKALYGIKDASAYVDKLFSRVKTTLISGLGMNREVVHGLLSERHSKEVKHFTPTTQVQNDNSWYCVDIFESQR